MEGVSLELCRAWSSKLWGGAGRGGRVLKWLVFRVFSGNVYISGFAYGFLGFCVWFWRLGLG